MKDFLEGMICAAFGFGACFCLLVLPMAGRINELQKEAVSHGFATYNPTNGNWQWRTNESKTN